MISIVELARTKATGDLEKIAARRNKQLDLKNKQLSRLEDKILEYKDTVSTISVKLKEKRDHEKDFRVRMGRSIAHNKTLELDRTKRPADRTYEIRNYSKMDMDVWRYDQMRGWFNNYATPEEPYELVPSKTGYTLKI
jgi:hypothetical protein